MCQEYNGWTNYPTWNVALWLDNEQSPHSYFVGRATDLDYDVSDLATEVKEYIEEQSPVADRGSMWNDIVGWTLGSVDWRAIAESFCETARDYAEHDDDYTEDDDD